MKYYSEKLKKLFDSTEELEGEEKKFEETQAIESKKREERATRAKEVDEAYKHYLTLLKSFVKDYGSYHYSIKGDNDFDEIVNTLWHWPF